jgi:RNA polymerase sigma factor (sigma-70 family)
MSSGDPLVRHLGSAVSPTAEAETESGQAEAHSRALGEIARTHHRALVRFLVARTGSAQEAQEVAQEAYARMLALDRPGTVSYLERYLWKIAAHIASDRKRHRDVRARLDPMAFSDMERVERSPETVVDVAQQMAILTRALEELTPKCLEAFHLRVLQGMAFDEVGMKMGISARMAKKYVARALEHCQHCLDAQHGTRRDRR